MRIVATMTAFCLISALSAQASACEYHTGGMFGQLSGAAWTSYDPAQAEVDALLIEDQLSKWNKRNEAAEAKRAKPSFSKASKRASVAAQARLAKRVKAEGSEESKAPVTAALETSTEAAPR